MSIKNDIARQQAVTPPFVSRLYVENFGDCILIVYPGQDGKFRFSVWEGESEPEPSEPFAVRNAAILAGKRAASR